MGERSRSEGLSGLGNVRVMLGLQQSLKMRRNGGSDRDISIKKKFQNTTNNFLKVVKI